MLVMTQEIVIKRKYHKAQFEILKAPERVKVIAKGRRFGLTTLFARSTIDYLIKGISLGLWVDTIYANIDKYIERYFMPELKGIPQKYWSWRQVKKELRIGRAICDFRSADNPENIEGFAYKFIFLNEAGIILKNRKLWENTIAPMMMDYSPYVWIGGTPKGKGLFYELYMKARDRERHPEMRAFRYPSYANPFLSKEVLNNLIKDLPENVRKQEIEAEFIEDSSGVFRNIEKCAIAEPKEPIPGELYFAGVDLGRLQDFTVISIVNNAGEQVFFDRFNIVDWKIQKERIKGAILKYNNARTLIDSTGVGDPIYEDLRREGLNIEGKKFDNTFKKQIIEALMIAMEKEEFKFFKDSEVQRLEFEMFEYEITPSGLVRYSAPEGFHDDTVIANALANFARTTAKLPFIWSV